MNAKLKTALIHIGLFVVTCYTTTLAGTALLATSEDPSSEALRGGMVYAGCFLFILAVHEFGHYFTAVYNRIRTSLPYFIPLPPGFLLGTMGAVIRIKDPINTKQIHFDIGVAGPLAGFVAAIGVLVYGFTHLPPPEYIFTIHPDYAKFGLNYAQHVYQPGYSKGVDIVTGKNLIFLFFERFVADPARMPNPHELIHYPILFAGFFSLVFTSLNLLPIGQLDGGHVLYGLVGYEKHRKIASVAFVIMLFFAGLGFVNLGNSDQWYWMIPLAVGLLFYGLTGLRYSWQQMLIAALVIFMVQFAISYVFPSVQGYSGWGVFLLMVRRFVGIEHPQAFIEEPLTPGRKLLGWLALAIFILCLTPWPLNFIEMVPAQ